MRGLHSRLHRTIAVLAAMTFNFTLNNVFTYRDQRLQGWDWVRGLLSFCVVCAVGAVANVCIATFVYYADSVWLVARRSSRGAGWCSLELRIVCLFHVEASMRQGDRFRAVSPFHWRERIWNERALRAL